MRRKWLTTLSLFWAMRALAQEPCTPQVADPVDQTIAKLVESLREPVVKPSLKHRAYVSPEEMRKYDSRTLGELLVQRLRAECDVPRGTPETSNGIDADSEVIMMVPSQVLQGIAEYGFQNQHMTQTTGGCPCRDQRFNIEQQLSLLRIPYSHQGRALLPKYSAFNVRRDDFGKFDVPLHYGDVAMVFKDKVKRRTTWTYSDSLGMGLNFEHFAGIPRSTKAIPNGQKCEGYCEAQIWGELDLTDVEYLMIRKGAPIPEAARKLGVPVYEYEPGTYPRQTMNFARGDSRLGPESILAAPSAPRVRDLATVRADSASTSVAPVKNILKSREFFLLPNSEIIERLKALSKQNEPAPAPNPFVVPPGTGGFPGMGMGAGMGIGVGVGGPYGGGFGKPLNEKELKRWSQDVEQMMRTMPSFTPLASFSPMAPLTPMAPAPSSWQPRELTDFHALAGELSTRPITPETKAALVELAKHSDPVAAGQALLGLTQLPWQEFKPFLVHALQSERFKLEIQALGIAADHLDDPEILSLVKAIESAPKSWEGEVARRWASMIQKKRLCDR